MRAASELYKVCSKPTSFQQAPLLVSPFFLTRVSRSRQHRRLLSPDSLASRLSFSDTRVSCDWFLPADSNQRALSVLLCETLLYIAELVSRRVLVRIDRCVFRLDVSNLLTATNKKTPTNSVRIRRGPVSPSPRVVARRAIEPAVAVDQQR